jgi:hypothetical protein
MILSHRIHFLATLWKLVISLLRPAAHPQYLDQPIALLTCAFATPQ